MDEIRFNIAATDYLSPQIWEKIKIAEEVFPYVSVEIPSIKQDFKLLELALKNMDKYGIDYLNLHDHILVDSDNKSIEEPSGEFTLNKVIPLKYSLTSVKNTEGIINLSAAKNYSFQIATNIL